jgi:hypothetical protein
MSITILCNVMVEIFIWDWCWLPKAGKNVPTKALKYA